MKTMQKKLSYYFLSLFFAIAVLTGFCFSGSTIVLAENADASSDEQAFSYVYDELGKLTKSEVKKLNKEIKAASENAGIDFYILFTDDLKGKSLMNYMEDFADLYEFTDTAFLCVSFDEPRGFEIQGYGTAEHYLTYDRINSIFDDMQDDLSDGYYYDACSTFISEAEDYMLTELSEYEDDSEYTIYDDDYQSALNYDDYDKKHRLISLPIQLGISLAVAGVIVLSMVFSAGGKITTTASTYLDEAHSRLLAKRDRYVRTSVTKHKIESSSSSSGHHGGGGTSSGGRSHSGGGGRSF